MVKIKEELVPPTAEEIGLVFPERTGIRSADERNYDNYLDTLQKKSQIFLLMKRMTMLTQTE